MITHTISVTELIWTLFCAVGLFYNAKVLRRALGDLYYVQSNKINSLREYTARLNVFAYSMLCVVQLAFVIIGIILMSIPPQKQTQPVSAIQVVLTVVFVSVSAILAVGAFINERGRKTIIERANLQEK